MLKTHKIFIVAIFSLLNLSACQTTKPIMQYSPPIINSDEDMDSDNDGVPDSKDQCPNTPLNVVVDVRGCPFPQYTDSDEPLHEFRFFFPKNQAYPFDNDKFSTQNPDTLRQNMFKPLEAPLAYIKIHPEKSLCISIEGHSSKGKYRDTVKNIDLQRALAVKQMYKEWFGFKEENITIEHYGAERPISPSDTPEHTVMNQRAFAKWYGCRKTK